MLNNTDYNSTYTQGAYNGPATLSSRIMLEYTDAALQIDPQPPQGLNQNLTQRIMIEYADHTSIMEFSLQQYTGPVIPELAFPAVVFLFLMTTLLAVFIRTKKRPKIFAI
jgi:hypothetical protein